MLQDRGKFCIWYDNDSIEAEALIACRRGAYSEAMRKVLKDAAGDAEERASECVWEDNVDIDEDEQDDSGSGQVLGIMYHNPDPRRVGRGFARIYSGNCWSCGQYGHHSWGCRDSWPF